MEYRNPTPTVDIIVHQENRIILIHRKHPPHGWALPGGFVDEGEKVEQAAVREAKEETGLDVTLQDLLYVYSDPKRDLRQHTMSVVFTATAEGEAAAADDADDLAYFDLDDLPELVFDHAQIISDFITFRDTGKRPQPFV
jgi:8-oxo-dGTP diphosphatase